MDKISAGRRGKRLHFADEPMTKILTSDSILTCFDRIETELACSTEIQHTNSRAFGGNQAPLAGYKNI